MTINDEGADSLSLNPEATGDQPAKDTPAKDTPEGDAEHDTFVRETPPPEKETPETPPEEPEDDAPLDEDDEVADLVGKLPAKEFRRVKKYREERREAREEAERAKAEAEVAKGEREALRAQVEALRWEKDNPEPDPVEDPEAFKTWAKEKAGRDAGLQKAAEKAAEKPAPVVRGPIDVMREAVRAENPDFDRFVSKAVIHRIETDPALHDRVWTAKNPPLEAYKVGRELILGKDAAKPRLSDAGSGFSPEKRGAKVTELSPEQKKIARAFGIPEKEMIADLSRKAGAR